jgi:hypothetical protein
MRLHHPLFGDVPGQAERQIEVIAFRRIDGGNLEEADIGVLPVEVVLDDVSQRGQQIGAHVEVILGERMHDFIGRIGGKDPQFLVEPGVEQSVGDDFVQALGKQERTDLPGLRLAGRQAAGGFRQVFQREADILLVGEAEDLFIEVALFIEIQTVFALLDFFPIVREPQAFKDPEDGLRGIRSPHPLVQSGHGERIRAFKRRGLIERGQADDLGLREEFLHQLQSPVQGFGGQIRIDAFDEQSRGIRDQPEAGGRMADRRVIEMRGFNPDVGGLFIDRDAF